MRDEYELHRGVPDSSELVALLNECFDDWGDERYLEWKLRYPENDDVGGVYVTDGEHLVGFRYLYGRRFLKRSEPYDGYVSGDACVHPEHRGNGVYSAMRDALAEQVEAEDADWYGYYTRYGHVPFEMAVDEGWKYRTLPLYLRVLSPESVVPTYAETVLGDSGVSTLLAHTGGAITLDFGTGQIRLDELTGASSGEPTRSLTVPVPDRLVTLLVELGSAQRFSHVATRRLSRRSTPRRRPAQVTARGHLDRDDFRDVVDLYRRVTDRYDLRFRREHSDLQHLLEHPELLTILTVERGGELVGFAPLRLTENGQTTEIWALDVAATSDDVVRTLADGAERVARKRDADLVLFLSDDDPGLDWARIEKQVLLWDPAISTSDPMSDDSASLFMGLYDVV
jgi:GNAT superfamily N-acetyltransferase